MIKIASLLLVILLGQFSFSEAEPTPTPIPTFYSPHGIIGGGGEAWTSLHTQGKYKKYYWVDIQPTSENDFSWTDLDSQVAEANAQNPPKQFIVLLNLNTGDAALGLPGLPTWLTAKGAIAYKIFDENNQIFTYKFLPWDPIFQQYALSFIAAFCDRYDGQIASVSMGGLGSTTEFGLTLPSPDGKTDQEVVDAWLPAAATITAQYAAHLKKTVFIAAIKNPLAGRLGSTTLQTYVDTALALYGSQLGFENWGLNASTNQSFLPNSIIYNHRLTNPVGFQMTGSATTGGGGDLCGSSGTPPPCLRAAMDNGVSLGAQYLQVFGSDTSNPIFFDDLDYISTVLLPPPGGTPPPKVLILTDVVSRKTHGGAGTYDVILPTDGSGSECRSGGVTGDYTMVLSFANSMSSCGTSSAGSVSSGPNPDQCTVELTGVPNAQYLTVTLSDAIDVTGVIGAASATMGVLVGDTNADASVNSADIGQTKAQSGSPVTGSNFREDVNADGDINSADIGFVKSMSGTALP
ncbi:MAG: dockerin type I domain-containing protein [Chthoniobacterales bacterium]